MNSYTHTESGAVVETHTHTRPRSQWGTGLNVLEEHQQILPGLTGTDG